MSMEKSAAPALQSRAGMGQGSQLDIGPSILLPLSTMRQYHHGMNHGNIGLSAFKDHGSLQEL